MKNKVTKMVVEVVIAALFGSVALAQYSELEKPTANLTEKWDTNISGWGVATYGGAKCGWTNGALAVKCLYQSMGDGFPHELKLISTLSSSGGTFVGDFSKIEAVSFDLKPNNLTLNPVFYFKSALGNKWSYALLGLCVNGQQKNLNLSLVTPENWHGYKGADFYIDKTNIVEVGFELIRGPNDLTAQDFSVDNFKLVGPWGGSFSNGVPLAWVMESGLTNDFATAGLVDSDSDGFSNAAEFMAGTDPINASSFFKIEIVRNSDGKMAVRWRGNRGMNFCLLEANSLGADGVFLTKTNIVPVTVQTEEVVVDQDSSNSKFYKVIISTNSIVSGN